MLKIVPLTLLQANKMIRKLHRHHSPVQGHRFSIGVRDEKMLHGAAVVGRPVSASLLPYEVAEVTRLVTDGTKNACSMLYSASARIAREMGFARIQTYILNEEPGVSLRAAGWTLELMTDGDTWTRQNAGRYRSETHPLGPKQRWGKVLNSACLPPLSEDPEEFEQGVLFAVAND